MARSATARAAPLPPTYSWSQGFSAPFGAEVFQRELDAVNRSLAPDANSDDQAEGIVKRARGPRNPIHSHFPWDDAVAAHERRLDIAKNLIRHLHVSYHGGRVITVPTRAFVSVRTEASLGRPVYLAADVVMDTPDLRAQWVAAAARDLKIYANKYSRVLEEIGLAGRVQALMDAIDAATR